MLEKEVAMDKIGPVIEEGLAKGQRVRITVVGNSMYPLFRNKKDSVILEKVTKRVKKGDVVLYKRTGGQYVLHRIIRIKGSEYSANGDNHYWIETPLSKEQFVGIMTGFYRNETYYSVGCLWYRCYSFLWMVGRSIRKPMLQFLRKILKVKQIYLGEKK